MPTVVLVQAEPSHRTLLKGYSLALRAEDPMPADTVADQQATVAAIAELISDLRLGCVWLIQVDGEPVGYAALTFVHSIEFGGRCGFIDELFVAPFARGQGAGRQALSLIADAARSLGVMVLLLEVSPGNNRAARLYERAGFASRKYRMMAKRL